MSPIQDLQDYLKSNFDIKSTIIENDVSKVFSYFNKISDVYYYYALNIFGLIVAIVLFFLFWKSSSKIANTEFLKKLNVPDVIIKNKLIVYIILFIIWILFVLYFLFYIFRKICMIKNYKQFGQRDKYFQKFAKDSKEINFKTGSIIQESSQWNWTGNYLDILISIFPSNYIHNIMVVNYKGHKYGLHFGGSNMYPDEIIELNKNKDIRLFDLEKYFKDNLLYNDKYRIFIPKKEIKYNKIFKVIDDVFQKDKYKFELFFFYNIHQLLNYRNLTCLSFVLKILYAMKILPLFNFNGILPDDMYFLPNMTDGFYKKEQLFTYK